MHLQSVQQVVPWGDCPCDLFLEPALLTNMYLYNIDYLYITTIDRKFEKRESFSFLEATPLKMNHFKTKMDKPSLTSHPSSLVKHCSMNQADYSLIALISPSCVAPETEVSYSVCFPLD